MFFRVCYRAYNHFVRVTGFDLVEYKYLRRFLLRRFLFVFLELVTVRGSHFGRVTGFDFVECKYMRRFFAKSSADVFRVCFRS